MTASAPKRGRNSAGPKSGAFFGSFSFDSSASYSPERTLARFRRSGPRRRVLVEIDRNVQLLADALAELLRQLDAILHGHAAHRNEGADVGRAEARVLARMLASCR